LGWYSFSKDRETIINEFEKIIETSSNTTKVSKEIEKTIKRLKSYPNNSVSF